MGKNEDIPIITTTVVKVAKLETTIKESFQISKGMVGSGVRLSCKIKRVIPIMKTPNKRRTGADSHDQTVPAWIKTTINALDKYQCRPEVIYLMLLFMDRLPRKSQIPAMARMPIGTFTQNIQAQ